MIATNLMIETSNTELFSKISLLLDLSDFLTDFRNIVQHL